MFSYSNSTAKNTPEPQEAAAPGATPSTKLGTKRASIPLKKPAALAAAGLLALGLAACSEDSQQEAADKAASATDAAADAAASATDAAGDKAGELTGDGACEYDGKQVRTVEGKVDCQEATATLDDYLDRRDAEGGGNANVVNLGEWTCNTPTAAVAGANTSSNTEAEQERTEVECTRAADMAMFHLVATETNGTTEHTGTTGTTN
ncbi:MAG TPA: hypothetical protein H9867_05165 [Candidatus Corynebacterium gallistercoris]|uniref:DUF3558 domain-containing protein n=1 Tax=Candidatus Corynebacterium gallistercoris TaxID=2838530 RepID=A0A9D1RY42_9CORY|nr:hypothetical protein [Candidatus Corynebacterium gallistercoris]